MDRLPANVSRGGLSNAITNRQAKPFTGIEVREAIEKNLLTLTEKLLGEEGYNSTKILELSTSLQQLMDDEFPNHTALQKVNVTYPKVGWRITTRLHRLDSDESLYISAECELDLERNRRILIAFGKSQPDSVVIKSLEDEKIPSSIPDRDRQKFGMPVFVDVNKPDGTVAKVNLAEVQSGPRKAARSVDVGRAALNQIEIVLPSDDGPIGISGSADAILGSDIVLPSELPEVTLDNLVATPPPAPPMEPKVLPPSGGMAKPRPAVKLKR